MQARAVLELADKTSLLILELFVPANRNIVNAPVALSRPAGYQYQSFVEKGFKYNPLGNPVLVTHGDIEQSTADFLGRNHRMTAVDVDRQCHSWALLGSLNSPGEGLLSRKQTLKNTPRASEYGTLRTFRFVQIPSIYLILGFWFFYRWVGFYSFL